MKKALIILLTLSFIYISTSSTIASDVKANFNSNDNNRSLEVQKTTIIDVFSVSVHSNKTDKNVKFGFFELKFDSEIGATKTTLSSHITRTGYKLFWILLPINVKK